MKRDLKLEKKLIDAASKIQQAQIKEAAVQEDNTEPDQSYSCPVCGGQEYETVKKSNGILGQGGMSWTAYYICAECSVMFKNPDRFLRKQEPPNLRLHELMTI